MCEFLGLLIRIYVVTIDKFDKGYNERERADEGSFGRENGGPSSYPLREPVRKPLGMIDELIKNKRYEDLKRRAQDRYVRIVSKPETCHIVEL